MKKKQRRKQLEILRGNLSESQLRLIKLGAINNLFKDDRRCLFTHLYGCYTKPSAGKARRGMKFDFPEFSSLEGSWISEGDRINKDLRWMTKDIVI